MNAIGPISLSGVDFLSSEWPPPSAYSIANEYISYGKQCQNCCIISVLVVNCWALNAVVLMTVFFINADNQWSICRFNPALVEPRSMVTTSMK